MKIIISILLFIMPMVFYSQEYEEHEVEEFYKKIEVDDGDLIEIRKYLPFCLADLFIKLSDLNLDWKITKDKTKKGHPIHPLFQRGKSKFLHFNMKRHINEVTKPKTTRFNKVCIGRIK